MGFTNLNPTDTLSAAVKRGDDYFVILAESDDQTLTGTIEITTPIAGVMIGQNSDFDQCGLTFTFPDEEVQPQTRVVAINAPLIARMPPTGVQDTPTLSVITGDAGGNINEIRPTRQAVLDGPGFPILELYVFLKQPPVTAMMRRDRTAVFQGATSAGVEIVLAQVYAYGRKSLSVSADIGAAAGGGTLRIVQRMWSLLLGLVEVELAVVAIPAAGDEYQYDGDIKGAHTIMVLYNGANIAEAQCNIEVRDY